jgi:hypothetical protein
MPAGSDGLTWSIFSLTCMRTTSRSSPHLKRNWNSASSAVAVAPSFRTLDRVDSASSTGRTISFSTWVGLELG